MTDEKRANWQSITITVLSVLVGLAFIAAGAMILMGTEEGTKNFQKFGYPMWFMYLTGVIEVASGVAMIFPVVRFWGAMLLICTMIGAIYSHSKMNDPFSELVAPIVLLLLCVPAAWSACPFCGKASDSTD